MKKRALIVLALCAALILSACGGAASGDAPQKGTVPEETPSGEAESGAANPSWEADAPESPSGEAPEMQNGDAFEQIAGTWISEESIGILTIYDNGGFLLDGDETLEGYLVYTEEDGEGLWDSGPRYELYLENNERVPDCYFALDDANPGKLAYAEGGGAVLYSRPDAVYDDSGIVLRVLRADERFFAAFAEVENFVHDDGEYSTEIAFCPTRSLRNFKFLSIAWQEANDDDVFFSTEELHSLDALTPERPLIVQTSFPGDMPSIGISYADADGATKYFAVGESGYDGALYLSEFTPDETP